MKFIVIILFMFCLMSALKAQYSVPASVFGNGGSPIASAGNHINGTLGQAVIGINTGSSDRVYFGFWNTLRSITTSVNDGTDQNLSSDYNIGQNYPNPFSIKTTITYYMPRDSHINLSIFNVLGELVVTLVDETKQTGQYTVDWDASNFVSGSYFCRLEAGGLIETRILQLVK